MASKKEARLAQKTAISSVSSREEKEQLIRSNLLSFLRHSSVSERKKIISYVPDRFEIPTFHSHENPFSLGEEFLIFYPKVTESGLIFLTGKKFEKGAFGILEPIGSDRLLPEEADWILVPALGWNEEGARLGRGKGFYDRSLQFVPNEKMIGLSFEELYPCAFSAEPHDLKVGQVFTDKKNHCFPKKTGEKSVP